MNKKSVENEKRNGAEAIAEKYGRSTRYVYRAVEFYDAIEILANTYGRDIRDLILNRHVQLNHAQVVRLASAVDRVPGAFPDLGHIIRVGDSQLLKTFIPRAVKKR